MPNTATAAMSMMSQKSFAAGELGMLVTDDRICYERAMAFGHYERNNDKNIIESEDLKDYLHIALGGMKGRVLTLLIMVLMCAGVVPQQPPMT